MHRSHSFPLFFVAVAATLLLLSCNEEETPTGPNGNGDTTKVVDTTSHDFVWEKTQIGVRHTVLRDVEAIAPDDVWICGDIRFEDTYTYDSLGNYIKPYNVAHWDGDKWTYQRIKWPGDLPLLFESIVDVKAFGTNDVWFCAGAKLAQWNGESFQYWSFDPFMLDGAINHMDGTSGNLYFAGLKGAMMKFNGNTFAKIHTGTDQNINDIWTANGVTMALANTINDPSHPMPDIVIFKDGQITHWYDSLMYEGLTSIWFADRDSVFLTGPVLRRYMAGEWKAFTPPRISFFHCIRGTAMNDVFLAGDGGVIHHYNGDSWHFFDDFYTENYFRPYAMSYRNSDVWITFKRGDQLAFVVHGRRR